MQLIAQMPLVTIVIPAYNVEGFVHRAVTSSLAQRNANVEVIAVDDGSTDNTLEVLKGYSVAESRLTVLSQKNSGVSVARNKALACGNGEYVIFLDADDWLEEDAVWTLLKKQETEPGSLICCERYFAKIDSDGKIDRDRQNNGVDDCGATARQALMFVGEDSPFHMMSACYKLFDFKLIRERKLSFPAGISNYEDGLFVFRYVSYIQQLRFCNVALWNILTREGSASTSSFNQGKMTALVACSEMQKLADAMDCDIKKHIGAFYSKTALFLDIDGIRSNTIEPAQRQELRRVRHNNRRYFKAESTTKQRLLSFLIDHLPQRLLRAILANNKSC